SADTSGSSGAGGRAASSSATRRSAASYTSENARSNELSSAGRSGWAAAGRVQNPAETVIESSAHSEAMRRPSTRDEVIASSGSHAPARCQPRPGRGRAASLPGFEQLLVWHRLTLGLLVGELGLGPAGLADPLGRGLLRVELGGAVLHPGALQPA